MKKWLAATLVTFSIGAASHSVYSHLKLANSALELTRLAAENITLKKSLSNAELEKKKAVTKANSKAKAKGRLRRTVTSIPFLGIAALGGFEYYDFNNWKKENPNGTKKQYICESLELTNEVLGDVLLEIPSEHRPSEGLIREYLPKCEVYNYSTKNI